MMNFIDVKDDFLPEKEFRELQKVIMGNQFPWYYNDSIVKDGDGLFQFGHTFYHEAVGDGRSTSGVNSDHYFIIQPLLQRLNVKTLSRAKANLNPAQWWKKNGGYHLDYTENPPIKVAIFYINTCNGYTEFKKVGKVKCVENRVVFFNSNLYHQGITCTNQKRKMVINFNYT